MLLLLGESSLGTALWHGLGGKERGRGGGGGNRRLPPDRTEIRGQSNQGVGGKVKVWAACAPQSPQTNSRVARFNRRIEEVLQGHHFKSGEHLEQTILRYVLFYNQQLPQPVLGSRAPLHAKKDWHKIKPELFKKIPYQLTGCDT